MEESCGKLVHYVDLEVPRSSAIEGGHNEAT